MKTATNKDGYTIVFVKSFRHWRTGKIVRRKDGGVIALRIRNKKR